MSEIELSKMVQVVFANPPSKPNSYKLDLSIDNIEMTDNIVDQLAKTTSNVLMNIFISGCQILFGKTVSPSNISKDQFELINQYMNSFGYNTNYEYKYSDTDIPIQLDIYFTEL